MNFPTTHSPLLSSGVPLEKLERTPNLSEGDKIREVSRQFEAVLLRQILTAARKTVIESGDESESAATKIYDDMITHQLADAISSAGTFGLARSLEVQLREQVSRPADLPPASPPAPTERPAGKTVSGSAGTFIRR
jgi:flagellar protein FlgJ